MGCVYNKTTFSHAMLNFNNNIFKLNNSKKLKMQYYGNFGPILILIFNITIWLTINTNNFCFADNYSRFVSRK